MPTYPGSDMEKKYLSTSRVYTFCVCNGRSFCLYNLRWEKVSMKVVFADIFLFMKDNHAKQQNAHRIRVQCEQNGHDPEPLSKNFLYS